MDEGVAIFVVLAGFLVIVVPTLVIGAFVRVRRLERNLRAGLNGGLTNRLARPDDGRGVVFHALARQPARILRAIRETDEREAPGTWRINHLTPGRQIHLEASGRSRLNG